MKPCTASAVLALAVTWAASCAQDSSAAAQLEPGAPADGFVLSEWVTGAQEVTDIAFLKDGRAVLTHKLGRIAVVMPDGTVQKEDQRIEVDDGSEKGLLGVVRDDQDRLYFYASAGEDDDDKHKVYRATIDAGGAIAVDMSRSIVGDGLEGPANHDGGGMVIHKGQLYVGVGDTGSNASPPQNRYSTCLNKPNAKILRVNLDGSIPDDNPLVKLDQVTGCSGVRSAFAMTPPDKRIYAWGLRNPWRLWIDPQTDLLWIGDVGEVTQEEITVGGKGAHHGYPFFEGTHEHGELGGLDGCMDVVPPTPCTPPQHGYPRSDGVSVTGGLIPPAGCGWGAYEQRYFFADYGSDRVWTLDVKPDRSGAVASSRKLFARIGNLVSFRMGPDGAMYLAAHASSIVHRLAPKSIPADCGKAAAAPVGGGPGAGPGATPSSGSGASAGGGSGAANGGGCGCSLVAERSDGAFGWGAALASLGWLTARARRRSAKCVQPSSPRPGRASSASAMVCRKVGSSAT